MRITEVRREANHARVTWTTTGSHHYQLEAAEDAGASSFSTVGPLISIPPGAPSTTQFLELGGGTALDRYYRVRLVP